MKENRMAKTLMIVGIIVGIAGIIVTIVISIDNFIEIWGPVLIGSLLSAILFFAFAEVIQLLQDAADTQRDILRHLTGDSGKSQKSHTTIVHDIEANLPPM